MAKRLIFAIFSLMFVPALYAQTATAVRSAVTSGSGVVGAVRSESARTQRQATTVTQESDQLVTGPGQKRTARPRADASMYVGIGASLPNVRGYTGIMPRLIFGYGSLLGRCKIAYLGIEAFAGAISLPITHNQENRVSSFIGGSLVPGFMYDETTLIYAKLGLNYAHYNNLNATRGGPMLGVGLQPQMNDHWDIRFEYTFTFNNSLNQYNLDFIYKFK